MSTEERHGDIFEARQTLVAMRRVRFMSSLRAGGASESRPQR